MAKKINIEELELQRDAQVKIIEDKLATLSPTSREAKRLRKQRLKLNKKLQKIKNKLAKKKVDVSEQSKSKKDKKKRSDLPKFKKKRGGISYEQRQGFVGFMFVLPWFLGFLFFFLQPLLMSLKFSLSSVKPLENYATVWMNQTTNVETGETNALFQHYIDIFANVEFVEKLSTTLTDLLVNVPVIIVFSLFVAVLLNRKFIGRGLARAIFFLPVIVTTGVVMKAFNAESDASAVMEGEISRGTLFQVTDASEVLANSGLPQGILDYLTDVSTRIFDIVWDSGIQILLFLAALQGISPSLYEASDVEGASAWETFWMITFPSVAPIIVVNVVYTIIDSFSSTDNILVNLIKAQELHVSTYSAMSWVYFVIIFAIIGVVYGLLQKFLVKNSQ